MLYINDRTLMLSPNDFLRSKNGRPARFPRRWRFDYGLRYCRSSLVRSNQRYKHVQPALRSKLPRIAQISKSALQHSSRRFSYVDTPLKHRIFTVEYYRIKCRCMCMAVVVGTSLHMNATLYFAMKTKDRTDRIIAESEAIRLRLNYWIYYQPLAWPRVSY